MRNMFRLNACCAPRNRRSQRRRVVFVRQLVHLTTHMAGVVAQVDSRSASLSMDDKRTAVVTSIR